MELTLHADQDNVLRVAISGKMTQSYTLTAGDLMETTCGRNVYKRAVLVDMRDVEAVDSSGINWLLQRRARFREDGGRMVLHSIPQLVANTLKMLRMNLVLEMADNVDAALAKLQGDPPA